MTEHIHTPADNLADALVDAIVARLRNEPGPLLLVLHAIQDELGYIPPDAIAQVAKGLNLSRAEVHGVVTFYHYFRQHPPGQHVMQVCRAEACQSMHCDKLIAHAKHRLGVDFHQTTADGKYTLEPVYCLGNCALAPAMMIDKQLHGRVSPQRFDEILKEQG